MSLFQHPHLTRGIVHTPLGAFTVNRGIVDLPDELGHSLGWTPVNPDTGWSAGGDGRGDRGAMAAGTSRPVRHAPQSR